MLRRLAILATLFSLTPGASAGQAIGVLRIRIVLMDRARKATPVPRHALLISINPSSAPPRRVVTAADGTATVRLSPGNYTVESDQPIAFEGRVFQWTQLVDIVAGGDSVLELNADNADADNGTSAAGTENDPAFLLNQWHNSIVAVWTATTHASGFLIDRDGLIATNRRSIGSATSVEVQLTPEIKVAGRVLVADSRHDVAVLQIDPTVVAAVQPLPLRCAANEQPPVADGQPIYAIEAPLRQAKSATAGSVRGVDARTLASDFLLGVDAAGGPVFSAGGALLGVTDEADDGAGQRRGDARVVRIGQLCDAVASAKQNMKDAGVPKATRLPVEPATPIPADALEDAARRRVGSLNPYHMPAADFDIAFLTPVVTYGALHQPSQSKRNDADFSNWSDYVDGSLPVLLIRVTPKLVEGFWKKVARGAAQTQGVALPPIKHFKSGFLRMRAYCGDAEATPIHPFKLEQRTVDGDAVYEGLYVFDPGALGPACASVKLVLYSEKEPDKADARGVEMKLLRQIWQDFEPYRP